MKRNNLRKQNIANMPIRIMINKNEIFPREVYLGKEQHLNHHQYPFSLFSVIGRFQANVNKYKQKIQMVDS